MATHYTTKYADKIAERFARRSITDAACGKDYSFVGARTVKILSVNTAQETPYDRAKGANRFGDPKNLDDEVQELTMTQQPAFTFVIDALDSSDQAIERSAGRALRRQLDEVTVPGMDKYRLKKWVEGANIQTRLDAAPTKENIVEAILDTNAAMTDALVPLEGRTLYIPTKYYKLLKLNPDFIGVDALGEEALSRGVVGEVDGCRVVSVPKGYLPEGVYFLIKHKSSTVDPVKLQQYDVLKKVQGYAGPVVQGVTYYDSFVLAARGDGLAVCGGPELILEGPALSIASHKVTATVPAGATVKYTVDGSNPRYSAAAKEYAAPVALEAGETFRCVAVKAGCVGMESRQAYV